MMVRSSVDVNAEVDGIKDVGRAKGLYFGWSLRNHI